MLTQQLPAGSPVTLVTVGPSSGNPFAARPLVLGTAPRGEIENILDANGNLPPEVRSWVARNAEGNPGFALLAGGWVEKDGRVGANAYALTTDLFEAVIRDQFPDADDFFGACALALFSRIGWEGEPAGELTLVAEALGLPTGALGRAGRRLDAQGRLGRQGRYVSVTPHPLAVYLAGQGWSALGDRVVGLLFDPPDGDLSERLLLRAADLGTPGPFDAPLERLLVRDGPLGSLAAVSDGGHERLLVPLCTASPTRMLEHVEFILGTAPEDRLSDGGGVRRNLVMSLQKLSWPGSLFPRAARALLVLARRETETWANNATGAWTSLFGTLLPATSARPVVRLAFLRDHLQADPDDADVALVVRAAAHALRRNESVMVYGEDLGGNLAEPRGTPETYADAWDYQVGMADVLTEVARRGGPAAAEAVDALVGAIHGTLDSPRVSARIVGNVAGLGDGKVLTRLRATLADLSGLYERNKPTDPEVTALVDLAGLLPPASVLDRLDELALVDRWRRDDGRLAADVADALTGSPDAVRHALDLLAKEPVPAAFDFGGALGRTLRLWPPFGSEDTLRAVLAVNLPAVVGYLWSYVEAGRSTAFDDLLEADHLFDDATSLALTVRGPVTPAGLMRVETLVERMPVAAGAHGLFGWHTQLRPDVATRTLEGWTRRLATQDDYDAVVDVAATLVHGLEQVNAGLEAAVSALVLARRGFPDVRRAGWDWSRLAQRSLPGDADAVVGLLLDLGDTGTLSLYPGDEESVLLQAALHAAGPRGWERLLDRVESGGWRLAMEVRGWLLDESSADSALAWVGGDSARAGVVASLAPMDDGPGIGQLARALLAGFGDRDDVGRHLWANYVSGGWTGPESLRVESMAENLSRWLEQAPPEAEHERRWLLEGLKSLRDSLPGLRLREAEDGH